MERFAAHHLKIFADGSIAYGSTFIRARISMDKFGRRTLTNNLMPRVAGIDIPGRISLDVSRIWHSDRLHAVVADALNAAIASE